MKPRPCKKIFDAILVGLFALVLSLPITCSICGFKGGLRIDEFRTMAKFPSPTEDAIGLQDYCKQAEKYFDDHFGLRDFLIASDLHIQSSLFPGETHGYVLIGNHGWLYYLGEKKTLVNDRLGIRKLTRPELESERLLLEKRRDELEALGIKYMLVVAPNKESVYPEYLPSWLRQPAVTKLDQFIRYMRLHSAVDIVDLRAALRQENSSGPSFFKTDTHWNMRGGFLAYQSIMTRLTNQFPEAIVLRPGDFNIVHVTTSGGDLGRFLAHTSLLDDCAWSFVPKGGLPGISFFESDTNQLTWEQFAKLPYLAPSEIVAVNNCGTNHIMIFGDSFGVEMEPFFGLSFGKSEFFDKAFDPKYIDRDKPNVVIEEIAERFLF